MEKNLDLIAERPTPPKFEVINNALAGKPLPDKGDWTGTLAKSFGLQDRELATMVMSQLGSANFKVSPENCLQLNGAIAAVSEIAPKDPVESMLALQMISCNTHIMKLLEKVTQSSLPLGAETTHSILKMADKLMGTYTKQMETLTRYRRKGKQTMTIEHVTVEAGGQAVIGNVAGAGGGQE